MTSIIKVNTIQDAGGNALLTSDGSGTITTNNIGGQNTPAFSAYLSADHTITDNTFTKIQFNTEVIDSDNTYDNSSNYRFTPGVVGKFIISTQVRVIGGSDNQLRKVNLHIYKNGSSRQSFIINPQDSYAMQTFNGICNLTDTATATDYYEVFCQADVGSGTVVADGDNLGTWFAAHKIIGA